MDFYLTNISSGERLRIPLLPDRLNIKTGAMTTALTIIKKGEVKIPRGSTLTGYSWNGVFPSENMETASFVFDWQEPARIVALLVGWEEKGDTLRLMITDLSINADVFIESFTYEYYGVGDCAYTLNLTTKRELTVTTVPAPPAPVVQPGTTTTTTSSSKQYGTVSTNGGNLNVRKQPTTSATILGTLKNGTKVEILGKTGNWYIIPYSTGTNGKGYIYASYVKLNTSSSGSSSSGSSSGSSSKTTSSSSSSSSSSGSYTVKSGDTLYSIAKAMLGDGSRWMEIYNLNQAAIDKANAGKTVGKYTVTAGLSLKLPAKKTTTTTAKTSASASNAVKNVVSTVKSTVAKVTTAVSTVVNKVVTSKPVSTLINTLKTATQKATATKTTTTSAKATTVKKTVTKPTTSTKVSSKFTAVKK